MSTCLKIRVKGFVSELNSPDGFLYLDLDSSVKIRETKRITERTDLNQLKFDYVLGITVPNTHKNFKIFEKYLTLNRDEKDFKLLPVQVITGSSILDDTFLYVTEASNNIELQLFLGKNHWIIASKDFYLNQLDLGSINFSELLIALTNINTNDNFLFSYFNNTDIENRKGLVFPLAQYGNLLRFFDGIEPGATGYFGNDGITNKLRLPTDYWRPFFVIKYILEKGFCQLGWKFKSDFFETEYGRRAIAYLIDPDYGRVPNEIVFTASNKVEGISLKTTRANFSSSVSIFKNNLYRTRIPFRTFLTFNDTIFNNQEQSYSVTGELNLKGKLEVYIYSDKNFIGSKRGSKVRVWIGTDKGQKISDVQEIEVTKFYTSNATSTIAVPSIPFPVNQALLDSNSQAFLDTLPSIDEYESESEEPSIESQRVILRESLNKVYDKLNINYDINNFCLYHQENIVFYIEADNTNIRAFITNKTHIEIFRTRRFTPVNKDVEINSFLSPKISFLDLLKGITHALNLKWTTDFLTKTVEAFPVYTIDDIYGKDHKPLPPPFEQPTKVSGFLIEESIENILHIVDKKSEKIIPPPMDTPRYVHIKWKESSDNAIEERFNTNNSLYSRFLDFGDDFENVDVKSIENPLFAPTANTYFSFDLPLNFSLPNTKVDPFELPNLSGKSNKELAEQKLKDNEIACSNWNIIPRILYWFGDIIQSSLRNLNTETFVVTHAQIYNGVSYPVPHRQIPLALQASSYLLNDRLRESSIIFGTNETPSLSHIKETNYHKLYARELAETLYNQKIEYLVDWDKETYRSLNFRNLYYFQSKKGEPIFTRLIELKDYEYCSNLFTPSTFQIRKLAVVVDCEDTGTDLVAVVRSSPRQCNTFPSLSVTYDNNCIVLNIAGIVEDPITATFEYSDALNGTYNPIPNTTPTSAILCDEQGDIYIRATVDIDNTVCDDVVLTSVVSLCDQMQSLVGFDIISLTTLSGDNVHQALLKGDFSGYTYSLFYDIGSGFVPYTLGDFIQNETIIFRMEYSKGVCSFEDIVKESSAFPVPPESLCGQVNASLEIIDSVGTKTFNRINFVLAGVLTDDYIIYRTNLNDPFIRWDEVSGIVSSYVEAIRVIIYDQDICPEYFSTVVTTDPECDCIDLDITVDIICDIFACLSFQVTDNTVDCTVLPITEVRWYKGDYLSGIADSFEGNLGFVYNAEQADYRIEVDFGTCTISSNVVSLDIPSSGTPILIAGK